MTLQEFATQVKNSDYSPEDKAHAIKGFFYSQVAKTDEFASASDDNKARVIKGFEIVMNEVSKPESNILEQAWSGFREGATGKYLDKATSIPLRKEVPIEERSQPLEFVREQFDKPIPPPEGIPQTIAHALGSVGSDSPMYIVAGEVIPKVAAVSKLGQLGARALHGVGTFAIPTAASTGGDIKAIIHSAGLGALLPIANLPAKRIFRALAGGTIGAGYTGATGGNKDEMAANSILFGVMSAMSPQMRFKVVEEVKANSDMPIAELPSIKEEFKKAGYATPEIKQIPSDFKKEYISPDIQSGKMKAIEEPKGFEGQPIETEPPDFKKEYISPDIQSIKMKVFEEPKGFEGQPIETEPPKPQPPIEISPKTLKEIRIMEGKEIPVYETTPLKPQGDVTSLEIKSKGLEAKPEIPAQALEGVSGLSEKASPSIKEPLTVEQGKVLHNNEVITPKETTNILNKASNKGVLKKQKAYLLSEIDKVIENAPDNIDIKYKTRQVVTEEGYGSRIEDVNYVDLENTPYIEIEVPNDGTFKIPNSKAELIKFRDKVKSQFPAKATEGEKKYYTEPSDAQTKDRITPLENAWTIKVSPKETWHTNGHILLKGEPSIKFKSIHTDRQEAFGSGEKARKTINEVIPKDAKEKIVDVDYFVTDPSIEGISKEPFGKGSAENRYVRVTGEKGTTATLNQEQYKYALKHYPDAEFFMKDNKTGIVIKSKGETVGVVIPMRDISFPEHLKTDKSILKSEKGGASLDLLVPESLERLANFTSKKITDAIPHLENIGKSVYRAGMKFNDFIGRMKDSLGDLWNKFKGLIPRIWMGVKKWNEGLGERGSVRIWDKKSEKWTETSGRVTPKDIKFDEKSVEPSPEITPKEYGFKGRERGAWKDTLKNFIGITSTELGRIHNDIKVAARKNVLGRMRETYLDEVVAKPFLDANKKLSLDDQMRLKEASLNGWENTARGIIGDLNGVKALFEKTRQRAIKAGYDIPEFTGFYFPRVVGDAKGLLNVLRQDKYQKEWSAIDDAIREIEAKKGGLTDVEKGIVADQILKGYPKERITLSEPYTDPAHMKSRKIKEIPPELLKYYLDLPETLTSYIKSMNHAIKTAEFFGKGKKDINPELITDADIQKSIGDYVIKLKKEGKLKAEDEFRLRDYLQAVFKPTHANYGVQTFKNLTYLQVLGQFSPVLTQIVDLALVSEKIGYKEAFKAYGKAIIGKSEIKIKDIGADKILYEFSQGGEDYIAKVLDKTLKLTGFSAIDRFSKEAVLNGKLSVMRKQARVRDPKLIKELKDLDLPIEETINDLIVGKKSEDVLFILANALSDLQPISELEVPKAYLKANYGKVFYMLKTYQLKLLDVYRNEVYEKIRRGTREEKIEGIKKIATLSTALFLLGASTDQIKDFMLQRDTDFNDMMWDNIFRIGGVSKYTLWQARQMGLTKAVLTMITPPAGILETGLKDLQSLVWEGDYDKDLLSTKYIPIGGGLYYWWFGAGAEKMRKKELKDK